ncbi:probable prefoldin subunit 2 [Coccomyxa sp. Obi]|nr:probable prefoldin subunit 2 [Coccomyxa sp. Obi]
MDGDRKCYRVVGEILVERTVAEVVPAVKGNKEQLDTIVERLVKQLDTKKKELSDFQEKYKIRIKGEDEEPVQQKEKSSSSQGILV